MRWYGEVVEGLGKGRTNKEIARKLGISVHQVKKIVREIMDVAKLDGRKDQRRLIAMCAKGEIK